MSSREVSPDRPRLPARTKDRPRQAGLLTPGSMFGPTFPVSQWCIGASLAGHSCGNSAIFPMASLLSALSGRPIAGKRIAVVAVQCKRRGKAAPWIVGGPTSAVLGALRISGANSSSRLRNGGLAGIRTRDLQIKSPLLYQLSYEPILRGKRAPYARGRFWSSRASNCRAVRCVTGSRQSGAISHKGARTKRRLRNSGCGIVRPCEAQMPPLHAIMSRSSGRSPQRRPGRRPALHSIRFNSASNSGGARSLSKSATALAYRRVPGPIGRLTCTRDAASTLSAPPRLRVNPGNVSRGDAEARRREDTNARGLPHFVRMFDPMPMR